MVRDMPFCLEAVKVFSKVFLLKAFYGFLCRFTATANLLWLLR
jgi:hypothetical protein